MDDAYPDFSALAKSEREGIDFRVVLRRTASEVCVVAPHGGAIEPGTSEIAGAVAGDSCSLYVFEGLKLEDNSTLHITSTRFDEPGCLALVEASAVVITVHGEHSSGEWVCVGGRDTARGARLAQMLSVAQRGDRLSVIDSQIHISTHPGDTHEAIHSPRVGSACRSARRIVCQR